MGLRQQAKPPMYDMFRVRSMEVESAFSYFELGHTHGGPVGYREGDLPPSRASRQERSLVYNRPGFVLNKCQSFRAERHV